MAIGVLTAVLLGFVFIRNVTGPLTRFSTETPAEVDLDAGAERTIYVRTPDESSSSSSYRISCQVADVATGRPTPTSDTFGLTLTLGDESFLGVEGFQVEQAGRYRVSCAGSEPARLAIGPRLRVFREVGRVFGAVIALIGGLALGAVVVTVVAVRRHHHRRFLQSRA